MKTKLITLVYSAVALLLTTGGFATTAEAHNPRYDVVARDHHGRNVRRFEYQPCRGHSAHAEHWYASRDHWHFCPGNLAHGHHDDGAEIVGAILGGILKGLSGDGD